MSLILQQNKEYETFSRIGRVVSWAYLRALCSIRRWHNIHIVFVLFILFPAFASAIPLPNGQQIIDPYVVGATTKISNDVASMRPISVSGAATERGNLHLQVRTGSLDSPMDAYFAILAQPVVPGTVLMLAADGSLLPVADKLIPWKSNISSIDEAVFDGIALSDLPVGDYTFYLLLAPAGSNDPLRGDFYLWASTLALSAAKDSSPPASALTLDKSTILMGDTVVIGHTSIRAGVPVTITFDDGSDFSATIAATPTIDEMVTVSTPILLIEKAPYLRSGSVNITLEDVLEIASLFIVEPPELIGIAPGEITEKVLQFNLDNLQSVLDNISIMGSEEQATMATLVSSIQAQQEIIRQKITQVTNQQVSIELDSGMVVLGVDELMVADRLLLTYLLAISEQDIATEVRNNEPVSNDLQVDTVMNITVTRENAISEERLAQIERDIIKIRETANSLADDTLRSIKNVGVSGEKLLFNGATVVLGTIAVMAEGPLAVAAAGTAALVVVVDTVFSTAIVPLIDPAIDVVNNRAPDLRKAASKALDGAVDGFTSISLGLLGQFKWAGAKLFSAIGLARDAVAGSDALKQLTCGIDGDNCIAVEDQIGIPNQSVCPSSLEVDSGRFGPNINTRSFDSFIDSAALDYIKICDYKDTTAKIWISYSSSSGACGQIDGPTRGNGGVLNSTERTVEIVGTASDEAIMDYWNVVESVLSEAVTQQAGKECAP